jgi:hypothetical protein
MEKVFCNECKHYEGWVDMAGGVHHDCHINTWIDDTPIRRHVRPKDSRDINCNNDCTKFERKLSRQTKFQHLLKEIWWTLTCRL